MAVQSSDITLQFSDLLPEFPVTPGHSVDNLYMSAREYSDGDFADSSNPRLVVYMHGSGGTGRFADDAPLITELTSKGFSVLSVSGLDTPYSAPSPWTYGYGNVQSPMLYGRMIKSFWQTQVVVRKVKEAKASFSTANSFKVALLGHSLGAQQAFAWGSLVHDMYPDDAGVIDCLVGNGATIAGTGNYRWNAIHRNISAYSNIFRRVQHPSIAYYSDDDPFCPRDFSERLRMTLQPGQNNMHFISPGALGHDWFDQRPDLVAGHLQQLFDGSQITIDSTDPASPAATPGP